jgi:hypothetical protein
MHFFMVILLAVFPLTLGIPVMLTADYFRENDSGTRVEARDMWVETNSDLRCSYLVIFTVWRVKIIP